MSRRAVGMARRRLAALCGLTLGLTACDPGPDGSSGATATAEQGERAGPVVLFVLIDALRRDRLGVYGHPRPTSPTLDRLAREGLFLADLVAHSSQTVPSTLSILSSRLPHEHGVQYDPRTRSVAGSRTPGAAVVPEGLPLLAEILAEAGFFTAAIVANPWLQAGSGFERGFAEYVEFESRDGAEINRVARRILAQRAGRKTFLYLHYMDVHNPYEGPLRRPAPFARPPRGAYVYSNGPVPGLSRDDLEFTQALYDERIVYVDGHLAELIDFAHRIGLDADLTVVVTSDHGDEFYEHGGLGHGTTLYGELIDSFAIFWNPGRIPARRIDRRLPAIDLVPILLDGLGLSAPAGLGGRPLAVRAESRPIFAELADRKAVIRGDWKLQVDLESGAEELHALDGAGRGENAPRDDPEQRALLRALLEPLLEASRSAEREEVPYPAEARRRLRALGYLDAGDGSP